MAHIEYVSDAIMDRAFPFGPDDDPHTCVDCERPLAPDEECKACVPRCGACDCRLKAEGRTCDPGSYDSRDWSKKDGELCEKCQRREEGLIWARQVKKGSRLWMRGQI